jgi:polar amino acid transport system permease protein
LFISKKFKKFKGWILITFYLQIAAVLMKGVGITVFLFFITSVFSIPLGLGSTFLSVGKNRFLRTLTGGYVFLMRGTPLMLQLFFFYYGLKFIPGIGPYLSMSRLSAACVAFVLNYAAYYSEIFRGGLLSVDIGQYEAAQVLGLSRWTTTIRVVLPQMFKVTLPAISNEEITLIKDTALVTSIGLTDLLHFTKSMVNTHVSVVPYFIAAIFYLSMTFGLTRLFNWLERKFAF